MDFKTYQKKARETAQYPNLGSNNIYPTLGLVGEAGEVAEKVKKVIRLRFSNVSFPAFGSFGSDCSCIKYYARSATLVRGIKAKLLIYVESVKHTILHPNPHILRFLVIASI